MNGAPAVVRSPVIAWGYRAGRQAATTLGESWLVGLVLCGSLIFDLVVEPSEFAAKAIGTTFGLMLPLVLAALASAIPILGGGGGIDLSVGPLMGLVNVIIVEEFGSRYGGAGAAEIVGVVVGLGMASGLVNGFLAAVLRIQPVVATLGTYLAYSGLALIIAPSPGGSAASWILSLANRGSFVMIAVVGGLWWLCSRFEFYDHLMAVGGDERAAYVAGVPVLATRIGSYVLAGVIAALGGLALTGLLGAQDPTVGPPYTLTGLAAAALGGVALAGGRGKLLGAAAGGIAISLIENGLGVFNVSSFALDIVYGAILIFAVSLNPLLMGSRRGLRGSAK